MSRRFAFWAPLVILSGTAIVFGSASPNAKQFGQRGPEQEGSAATVGHPDNPDALGDEMIAAYNRGARRIAIRGGTYNFSLCHHPLIDLSHWKNVKIEGHNATLVSSETDWGNEIIHMGDCNKVEIDDLILSQTWQTALQGKVTEVSTNSAGRTICHWQPDSGYPVPDPGAAHFNKGPNVIDGKTRLLKHGCGDQWDADLEPADGGGYKVSFARSVNVAVGDWLVARGKPAPCKVHLINCHECTLSNLTLLRNAFGSIMENDGGGNSYYNLHWQLGPKPAQAVEKPLVSCSVDGFHSDGCYPGPDIEQCEFSGVLLDDCIAIHGQLQQVRSSSGDTVVVDQEGSRFKVGQPIRIGGKGFYENAFVKSIAQNGDHTLTIKMDRALNVPSGSMVGNPLFNGQSFKIIDCHVGNTRSRGILVKADEGLISNNVISECGMSGVSAGPEYFWKEGDYVQDLTIKDNQFVRNGFVGPNIAALFVHGEGARGNRNVTIEGNSFDNNYSGDIDLDWTSGATVKGNTFNPPTSPPLGLTLPHAITVLSSSDVRISKNNIKDPQGYRSPAVLIGKDVQGVQRD